MKQYPSFLITHHSSLITHHSFVVWPAAAPPDYQYQRPRGRLAPAATNLPSPDGRFVSSLDPRSRRRPIPRPTRDGAPTPREVAAVRKTLIAFGCLALALLFVTAPRGLSQPAGKGAAAAGADEQAVRQLVAAYVEAFNKGDFAAIAAFWADDAEYTDEAGTTTKGRDAIAALFKQAFTDLKGAKMALKVTGVRLVKGVVALVDGTSTVSAPDGSTEEGRFSAVFFKDGDKWLLRSARDLPGEVTDATPGAGLKELQ